MMSTKIKIKTLSIAKFINSITHFNSFDKICLKFNKELTIKHLYKCMYKDE